MGLLKRLFGGRDAAIQPEHHPVVRPAETVAPADTFRTGRPQAPDGPVDWPTDPESGLVFDDAWLLAGLEKAVNENQYRAKLEARDDMATLRRERLFQPGLDGHDQQADMLRGRDWLEWNEHVHQMKREGYLECALALVYEMMDTARGSAYWDHKPPPGWYDQAAIILRKLKDFDAEVRLMEEALRNYPGSEDFSTRLEKAKALQLKASAAS
jgi:hypothetical protein